jgi:hypothetical protein
MNERPILSLAKPRRFKRSRNRFKHWLIGELNKRGESLKSDVDYEQLQLATARVLRKVRL